MAKTRNTVLNKWNDVWFSKLTPQAKLIWLYLCDNCDHVGVYEFNEDKIRQDIRFTGHVVIKKHIRELSGSRMAKNCGCGIL
jgi:hypothetical protein